MKELLVPVTVSVPLDNEYVNPELKNAPPPLDSNWIPSVKF